MTNQVIPNNLILYHYTFSPYARRVVWYLTLRQISYAQCMVPSTMPREVLKELNIAYRRIPLLSHGRDVYCDTRLILEYLEKQYPPSAEHPSITAPSPEGRALCKLLIRYHNDAGLFARAAGLLPSDLPALNDEKWLKDRQDYGMRKLSREDRERARPEGLVHMRDLFDLLENTLLVDGRQWLLSGNGPTLADIEAVWIAHWLWTIPGSLEPSLTEKDWPKTHAYIKRFDSEMKKQMKAFGKPLSLKDDSESADIFRRMELLEQNTEVVDTNDPTGFQKGEEVEIFPFDSGFNHKDRGELVSLTPGEMVVKKQTQGTDIRVHVPRWGFRIQRPSTQANL